MSEIYVSTFAKQGTGENEGDWLDPEDYVDLDEFMQACARLHKDEVEPEFRFPDCDDIPQVYVREHRVSGALWEYLDLDPEEKGIVDAFVSAYGNHCCDADVLVDCATRAYVGEYESKVEFAREFIRSTGLLDGVPEIVARYMDYDAYARDIFLTDYAYANRYVFDDNAF